MAAQLGRQPVHVTTGIEDGYSDNPDQVADYVAERVAHGVVGVNLVDSKAGHRVDPATLAAKVLAVKRHTLMQVQTGYWSPDWQTPKTSGPSLPGPVYRLTCWPIRR